MLIPTYSLYMPDMEARLRFFMLAPASWRLPLGRSRRRRRRVVVETHARHRRKRRLHYDQIMWVWPYTWGSGCLLLMALPFLGARISPVVSMCTAMPAVGAIRMMKSTCWKWGNMSGDFQHELAKQLLAAGGPSQGESPGGGKAVS